MEKIFVFVKTNNLSKKEEREERDRDRDRDRERSFFYHLLKGYVNLVPMKAYVAPWKAKLTLRVSDLLQNLSIHQDSDEPRDAWCSQ